VEDDAGKSCWSARIDPYGKAHLTRESMLDMPLRFPGHYCDSETGLHYNRFRYFSAELGRYLQSDPAGVEGGINLYAYPVNPLIDADIDGLKRGGGNSRRSGRKGKGAAGKGAGCPSKPRAKKPRKGTEKGKPGPYGSLPKRDGINNDHQPSSKSWKIRGERVKGSPLSDTEKKRIHDGAPAVPIPTDTHRQRSDTFGGRQHTKDDKGVARKEADSLTPATAQARDARSTGIGDSAKEDLKKQTKDFQKYIDSGGFLDENN
jgi:RHS repeat-associated protein